MFKTDQIIGICGAAWGDEGKGKFTDEFAGFADVVIRAQGGCNAGHTVIIENTILKLHHIPSGIANKNVLNIIGNGVVVDPQILIEKELKQLKNSGITDYNLKICGSAHVIMPWHRILDRAREVSLDKEKIGTTAKGIGPCYSDKIMRCGIRVNDLLNPDILKKKIETNIIEKEKMIFGLYAIPEKTFCEWMQLDDQHSGSWLLNGKFNPQAIFDTYSQWAKILKPMIADTNQLIRAAISSGKKILLEGAQGLLLDIDHGTFPFVTSSNCCAGGFSTGAGLPPQSINRIYNVMSAYMTRVGSGPFPTELGTEEQTSTEHASQRMDLETCKKLAKTAKDDYTLGKIIRHIAGEFGTTTGRPRRTGWFDAVACRQAIEINGPDVIISKLDVLDCMPILRICTAYKYTGPEIEYNGIWLKTGEILERFPSEAHILKNCKIGKYEEYNGWQTDITNAKSYAELPELAKIYLTGIEKILNAKIRLVSVGPKRNQTLEVK